MSPENLSHCDNQPMRDQFIQHYPNLIIWFSTEKYASKTCSPDQLIKQIFTEYARQQAGLSSCKPADLRSLIEIGDHLLTS